MDRGLTLDFVRVTEAAAVACGQLVGFGDKIAADDAAVHGMRAIFDTVPINGTVVIGEGEMDEAPMLYIGEPVGTGNGPAVDIAVDPLEGTNMVAKGTPGAIAVFASAEKGGLLHAPDMYMDKICVGPKAKGAIDITKSVKENMAAIQKALDKPYSEITVVLLERERHQHIVDDLRELGCRINFITDGDVVPAVATGLPNTGVDVYIGVGGAPEGVIAAAALKCLGGDMQGILWPEDDEDRERMQSMGIEKETPLTLDDIAPGEDLCFCATGVTTSNFLKGVEYCGDTAKTQTIVVRANTGSIHYINTIHDLKKKPIEALLAFEKQVD